ncbi:hypothetical protein NPA31_013520 [Aurantimonas sp. MSK8Z-1]|uniref:hypothetical protein n=1 Tax=Mangrovibrevibacter kandeliae TaxID=2968473 RepID=UPI002118F34C|nr:hypothetical protein [Aurantimonas sp. MSK8Z-1]MCW4115979.1 hypothetical protein [Aurantimonas sp. MSK8Z-1]
MHQSSLCRMIELSLEDKRPQVQMKGHGPRGARRCQRCGFRIMSLLHSARRIRAAGLIDRLKRVLHRSGAGSPRISRIDPSTLPARRLRDIGLLDGRDGTSDPHCSGFGSAPYRDDLL